MRVITRENAPASWQAQHDLAKELHALTGAKDEAFWRLVVSAIASGLPVALKARRRLNDGWSSGRIPAVASYTAILSEVVISSGGDARIQTRGWGISPVEWESDILELAVPEYNEKIGASA